MGRLIPRPGFGRGQVPGWDSMTQLCRLPDPD